VGQHITGGDTYRQSQYDNRENIISMTGRDYSGLDKSHASLKVWLPENVMVMLYEITVLLDTTISDFIRQVLFTHIYGRYDLLGHIERSNRLVKDPDHAEPCAKTVSSEEAIPASPITTSSKGNKVISLRVPLPSAMKADLQKLADKKYLPISDYTRRVIITHLTGHQE